MLEIVEKGYQIPFTSTPNPAQDTTDPTVLSNRSTASAGRTREPNAEADNPRESLYSPGFLLEHVYGTKKDGGQKPVINLKYLNHPVKEHFKMEGLHTANLCCSRETDLQRWT